MPELKQIGRYKLILDLIADHPAGLTIKQLTGLISSRFSELELNEHTLRRAVNDLLDVGWIETLSGHYFISAALGEYYFRRYQAVAERTRQPLQEMQEMFNRIGSTLTPNSREEADVR